MTRFRNISWSGEIGKSRLKPSGCRMNASQQPIGSPTYIRKFLPTFSHTWIVVASLVTRIAGSDLLSPSFSFKLSSLSHINPFASRKLPVSFGSCGGVHFSSFLSVGRLLLRSFSAFPRPLSPGNESAKVSAA